MVSQPHPKPRDLESGEGPACTRDPWQDQGLQFSGGEWNFAIASPIPSKPTIFIVKTIQRILKKEKHPHSSLTTAFSVFHPVCCILLGHTVL